MEFVLVGLSAVAVGAWLTGVPQPGRAAREAASELLEAARDGRVSLLTALVDSGVPVDVSGEAGETALMVAAGAGHTSAVDATKNLVYFSRVLLS